MPRKTQIAGLLLGGFILSVAVALGGSALLPPLIAGPLGAPLSELDPRWMRTSEDVPGRPDQLLDYSSSLRSCIWARGKPRYPLKGRWIFQYHAAGFPLRCFEGWKVYFFTIPAQPDVAHSVWTWKRGTMEYLVPWSPIWLGLGVNTLTFTLGLGLAKWSVGKIRRARRIRRGLCAGCGYPLNDLHVCPECGRRS